MTKSGFFCVLQSPCLLYHLFPSMLQQNLRLSIAFVVECFLYEHHCYRKYSDYLDESAEDFFNIFPSILSSMSADIPSARA